MEQSTKQRHAAHQEMLAEHEERKRLRRERHKLGVHKIKPLPIALK